MIQPPFPSTIAPQPRHVTFLTTTIVVRKNQENNDQTGTRACTRQCLRRGGGGAVLSAVPSLASSLACWLAGSLQYNSLIMNCLR